VLPAVYRDSAITEDESISLSGDAIDLPCPDSNGLVLSGAQVIDGPTEDALDQVIR
jgi:hypothetical protein